MNVDFKKWLSELNFGEIFKGIISMAKDFFFKGTFVGRGLEALESAPALLTGESAKQAEAMISGIKQSANGLTEQAAARAAEEARKLAQTHIGGGVSASTSPAQTTPPSPSQPAAGIQK